MKEAPNRIISMSLKDEVLTELDKIVSELELSGRSEAIRRGIKHLKQEQLEMKKMKGRANATLILVHNHATGIGKSAHKYQRVILSHLHNHFGSGSCADIFVLSGEFSIIRDFVESVQKIKGIKQSKLVLIS